jgi:hypothetical protein
MLIGFASLLNFFFAKTQKSIAFRCIDRKRRFMYKPKIERTPHHTTQPKETSLGEQLANTPSPCFRPHSCLIFGHVHQGGYRRLNVVGCVTMLPNPQRREQDQRRGSLAKCARGGLCILRPPVRKVVREECRSNPGEHLMPDRPSEGATSQDVWHDMVYCDGGDWSDWILEKPFFSNHVWTLS